MKTCSKCQVSKDFTCFYKAKNTKSGYQANCKNCAKEYTKTWFSSLDKKEYYKENHRKYKETHKQYRENNKETWQKYYKKWQTNNLNICAAIQAKSRAAKRQATPLWFEKEKVALVYKKAQEWGFEVDHIVPLQGKNVCGLHCWSNLQLLDKSLNSAKRNRFDI